MTVYIVMGCKISSGYRFVENVFEFKVDAEDEAYRREKEEAGVREYTVEAAPVYPWGVRPGR